MGFMNSFERVTEKLLVPIATKLNSQRHLTSIRDAFILSFPLIMAGSIITLINFAILSPDGFIAKILFLPKLFPNLADYQAILSPVTNGSVNILSIFIAFLVARNMAIHLKADELLCGLTSLSCYFIVYTPYKVLEGGNFLTTQWLGAQGLFVAIIVGVIVGEVFSRLSRSEKLQIKMPDQVPPAVARTFKVLIPIIFVTIFFAVLTFIISRLSPGGVHELVYNVLQAPLKNLGNNIFSVLALIFFSQLLWVFGIHGPNTLAAIKEAIFTEANLKNLEFVSQHGSAWGAPFESTYVVANAFANIGGSGATLGLIIAIFIASRRKDHRNIAKLSVGPGLFNINEPIIFGVPMVLNPLFIIPFVFTPMVTTFVGYLFIKFSLIPPLAYQIPWTTPVGLYSFLGTGGNWLALIVGLLCLAISVVIYLPFVIAANKAEEVK